MFMVTILIVYQSPTTFSNEACFHQVVSVQKGDVLVMRFGPAVKYREIGTIPYHAVGIKMTGPDIQIGKSRWVPIRYQQSGGWVNRAYLSDDCHQLMTAATVTDNRYHTVVSGDTLYSISQRYGYKVGEIAGWNQLQSPYNLSMGQRLRISAPSECYYRVFKVKEDDMLWIRSTPKLNSKKVGAIPYNGIDIQMTGAEKTVGKSRWVAIKYKDIEGWVNRAYLEKDC